MKPIAVIDSGVGGLTVLRELQRLMPSQDFLYLADTARYPFGRRQPADLERIALELVERVTRAGAGDVVLGCNTLSAHALHLFREYPVPVHGMIEAGARAALSRSGHGRVLVIASEATVKSGAHLRALEALRHDAQVTLAPCPEIISLVEHGRTQAEIVAAARHLFRDLLRRVTLPEVVLLGCTHLGFARHAIAAALPPGIEVVDPARVVAEDVARSRLLVPELEGEGVTRFLATGDPDDFADAAARWGIRARAERLTRIAA